MRKSWIYIGLALLVGYIGWKTYAFEQAKKELPERRTLIQAAAAKKLDTYGVELRNKCEREMLDEAQLLADSITFIKANSLMLFDTLIRPPKPGKPELPDRLPLKDSLNIAPLVPAMTDSVN